MKQFTARKSIFFILTLAQFIYSNRISYIIFRHNCREGHHHNFQEDLHHHLWHHQNKVPRESWQESSRIYRNGAKTSTERSTTTWITCRSSFLHCPTKRSSKSAWYCEAARSSSTFAATATATWDATTNFAPKRSGSNTSAGTLATERAHAPDRSRPTTCTPFAA